MAELGRGSAARALQAHSQRMPRSLDGQDHRVAGRGRLLVDHEGRRRPHRLQGLADLLVRARRHRGAHPLDHAPRDPAGDVHRDGPAEARSPQGALPARLHAQAHRRARGRDPRDHAPGARPARAGAGGGPGRRGRPARRLASDRELHGHRRGGRRDLGAPHERDHRRGRRGHQPRRPRRDHAARHARDLRALPEADRGAARESHRGPDERPRPRGVRG